jgi:rare lipoprotein A
MPFLCRCLPVLLVCFVASCATKLPDTTTKPVLYNPHAVSVETGIASWYKDKRTASGERFNGTAMAAAHKKLPFGTKVRVIDLKTGKSIIVRINDRGPYIRGRIIDLTIGAARQLGTYHRGIAKVRIEVLKEIPLLTKPNLREKPAAKPKPPAPAAKPAPAKPSAPPSTSAPAKPPAEKPASQPASKPATGRSR